MKIQTSRLTEAEQTLLRALGEPDPKQRVSLLASKESAVLDVALVNEVASTLAHRLADAGGWESVGDAWRSAHDETSQRTGSYMAELDEVAALLAGHGIPVVALKNAGIARGIHTCPGCSPMGDVDVLVRETDFRAAHHAILSAGYEFQFRSPLEQEELEAAARSGGGEYVKVLGNGEKLWLEVQWRPVAGRWIRPDQEPDANMLIEQSVPIPRSHVRLLAPEDNLLQVALHTAKHSYVRAPGFRLHLDVDRIVRGTAVDWDVFVERVHRFKVRTPVYFSLALPRAMFGSPIPSEVLDAIHPGAVKARVLGNWIQRAGLFGPNERKFGNAGFLLFNALLYDDMRGRLRAVFPEAEWMRQRYEIRHRYLLPLYHLRRLADLGLRRTL